MFVLVMLYFGGKNFSFTGRMSNLLPVFSSGVERDG